MRRGRRPRRRRTAEPAQIYARAAARSPARRWRPMGLVLAVVAVVLVLWLLLGTDAASALASWSLGFG